MRQAAVVLHTCNRAMKLFGRCCSGHAQGRAQRTQRGPQQGRPCSVLRRKSPQLCQVLLFLLLQLHASSEVSAGQGGHRQHPTHMLLCKCHASKEGPVGHDVVKLSLLLLKLYTRLRRTIAAGPAHGEHVCAGLLH